MTASCGGWKWSPPTPAREARCASAGSSTRRAGWTPTNTTCNASRLAALPSFPRNREPSDFRLGMRRLHARRPKDQDTGLPLSRECRSKANPMTLTTGYDPISFETRIYTQWESSGVLAPAGDGPAYRPEAHTSEL